MSRVTVTHEDGVAMMRLTRGDAGNAIDFEWVQSFGQAVTECAGARAVLISADGRAFTVGGDLKHFASRIDDLGAALDEMVPDFHEGLKALSELPMPVVAAVQGPIAGGGMGVAFCADIVLASPNARFVCGFSLLGLSGDGGGSWWLPRLVGPKLATEMMMLNRPISAEEAVTLGLVNRVVAPEDLERQAQQIARALAAGPPLALAHMKRNLRAGANATLAELLDLETAAMLDCGATEDAREGVDAFGTRRTPRFSGR